MNKLSTADKKTKKKTKTKTPNDKIFPNIYVVLFVLSETVGFPIVLVDGVADWRV